MGTKQTKNKPRTEGGALWLTRVKRAQGSPVYWPRKETLSFCLMLPSDLVPSCAAWGGSSEVLLFSDDSPGDRDLNSEPVWKGSLRRGR